MPTKYSTLRIAAATVATGVLTLGSALPVFAVDGRSDESAGHQASTQHRQGSGRFAQTSGGAERRSAQPSQQRDSHASERSSSTSDEGAPKGRSARAGNAPTPQSKAHESHGRANPPRHTPVTVCHLLGNGSYHLLTMDDSALKAHVGHDDLYPVPEGGCPSEPVTGETGEVVPSSQVALETVLDIQRGLLTQLGSSGSVLGVQAERTTNRSAVQVAGVQGSSAGMGVEAAGAAAAPATGVLPQTGAGEVGVTLAAGLGLLAVGAGLLARRRFHGAR